MLEGAAQHGHDLARDRDVVAVLARGVPLTLPPRPSTRKLKLPTFISTQRFQVILRGSILSALP